MFKRKKEGDYVNEAIPIYMQISQMIEDDILSGHFKVDDKVPSTNEFAKMMQVNPATAGKGLNDLVDQDILYKKRGMGMYVTAEARDLIIAKRQQAFSQQMLPAFLQEAKRLDISLDHLIEMIKEEKNA
ncbi:GntR family transcriptional regulator [Streptococcus pluranimalium]|uniref:GntR family transcriptional regulator n=1 Tax=Streptococcus pluranimalium TaxID=82348 RepID=UPI002A76D6AA|nr:GntR family transcriptional regulator [Streptococcus pluranimalium]